MNRTFKSLFQQIPPFLVAGISIALVIGIFIIFSYILVWGLVIGAVLFGANYLFKYFRSLTAEPIGKKTYHQSKGRIIEHDDS